MSTPVTLHKIGLVVHGGKRRALNTAAAIEAWARERAIIAKRLDVWSKGEKRRHAKAEMAAAGVLDLIVTIGGDGTFLRGIRIAAAADVPVLGVDVGRVGFLTEVEVDQAIPAIEAFAAGTAVIEQRLTLTLRANRPLSIPQGMDALLRYRPDAALPPPPPMEDSFSETIGWGCALDVTALNDVTFEKLSRDRQASLAVYIDGRRFVSYSADALVVATPTGSTAYSFAAGGPVVSPRTEALIFTPIAAHMTFDRSLVVAADESIGIRVLDHSGEVVVAVDGQIRGVLEPGDWVGVHERPWRARLVRLCEPDFFGRVRDRFHVAGAAAADADGSAPATFHPSAPIPPDLQHLYLPMLPRDEAKSHS